jgi:hypothetical protein
MPNAVFLTTRSAIAKSALQIVNDIIILSKFVRRGIRIKTPTVPGCRAARGLTRCLLSLKPGRLDIVDILDTDKHL